MKSKFISLIVWTLFMGISTHAQEILLNNYRYNTTLLNPAMVGNQQSLNINAFYQFMKDEWRPTSIHYQSYGLNLDAPILTKEKYVLAIGYRYYGSIQGEAQFKNKGHLLSASFSKIISEDDIIHRLSIGIEGGLNIRGVSDKDLRWQSQIGPNGFNPSITGESISDAISPDLNGGIQYHFSLKNGSSITMGYAIYQLNKPSITLLSSEFIESIRTNIYINANYRIHPKFELQPSILYVKHGSFDAYNVSLGSKYYIKPTSWICLDLGYLKNERPYVGISAGINKIAFFGNYGLENNASLTRIETGLMYRFVDKSKS